MDYKKLTDNRLGGSLTAILAEKEDIGNRKELLKAVGDSE